MVCTSCGVERSTEAALVCQQCGNAHFQANYKSGVMGGALSADSVPYEHDEQLALFVGEKKKGYYFKKWDKEADKRKLTWNWAAYFLSIFWFGYRKMYKHIAIILSILVALDIVTLLLNIGNMAVNRGITFGGAAVIGIMANSLYKKHAEKKISEINATYSNKEQQHIALKKAGGTSWGGVGIALLAFIGYLGVFFILATAAGRL
jgi:hypothetical protein